MLILRYLVFQFQTSHQHFPPQQYRNEKNIAFHFAILEKISIQKRYMYNYTQTRPFAKNVNVNVSRNFFYKKNCYQHFL